MMNTVEFYYIPLYIASFGYIMDISSPTPNGNLLPQLRRQLPQQEPRGAVQLPLGAEVVLLAPRRRRYASNALQGKTRGERGTKLEKMGKHGGIMWVYVALR